MEYIQFKRLVAGLKFGKQLPDAVYLHQSVFESEAPELRELVDEVSKTFDLSAKNWNIAKFMRRDFKLTLLNYPDFDTYAYPALHQSNTVDLTKRTIRKANYSKSDNPPILHRKEAFVLKDYPNRLLFREITLEAEAAGLFEKTRSIGFKQNWERLIRAKGYYLDDNGRLHKKETLARNGTKAENTNNSVDRHKTAIDRNQLSAPMKLLSRHGYLDGEHSVLDFGCGKGDDLRELEAHGIDVNGWDPVHRPEGKLCKSNIVNLGFVLNVIEDVEERDATLRRAYDLTQKLLIAAVMVAGESTIRQFAPFKDGVITSRNTFQRYYTQAEFKNYIERTLSENAIAVGQGIYIVFKDKLEEQRFLLERQHISRNWKQKTHRKLRTQTKVKVVTKNLIEKHQQLFDHFWETTLDLGRIPANPEFKFSERIRAVAGSHKKAFDTLEEQNGNETFLDAQQARQNDLLVYFALGLFERRKPYKNMPDGLKRDIKVLFGSYTDALAESTRLLFSVGNPKVIESTSNTAYEKLNTGEMIAAHSWIIPKEIITELPPELRIYIGCATQIYGDVEDMHLIKIHFTSGKVSLMRYDDFSKEKPLLIQRVKIKLRELDVDFFDYGVDYDPPPLTNKSAFT